MTKADLIKKISSETGVDKAGVSVIIENFFITIKSNMGDGSEIFIRGFGSFIIKQRARKLARNITANTPVMVEAHIIPQFRPAPEFIELIRNSQVIKKVKDKK
jgi:DNA-binding protein HU-beta